MNPYKIPTVEYFWDNDQFPEGITNHESLTPTNIREFSE